jgi:hypothetical protein
MGDKEERGNEIPEHRERYKIPLRRMRNRDLNLMVNNIN